MKSIILITALLCAYASTASAECANGCSGHGYCGANDMCTCYRNFQGTDCSERVCPYGLAFVTTPQGDLNSDGDRDDNSWKRLSQPIKVFRRDTGEIEFVNNLVNTADSDGSGLHELEVNDKIRVGTEVFTIETKTDDKNYVTTSHAMHTYDGFYAYKFIATQARPAGTWEMWPGDFPGSGSDNAEDEGHYHMECSNRGLCDRKTGECECFDGYNGIACGRQACPEGCSGHGQCETVENLRTLEPTKLGFTVQTNKDSAVVYTSAPHSLTTDDFVRIGDFGAMKIKSAAAGKFTLENEFPKTLPLGTHIWQEHHYDLWDSKKNRACKCDPMWTGYDCSLRKCPFGDDPLTVTSYDKDASSGGTDVEYSPFTQKAEKQSLWIESSSGRLTGTFTLTFTDEYGDKWETLPIPNRVRFSERATVVKSTNVVTFENKGIAVDELGINDYIMIGQDVCRVKEVSYFNAEEKLYYKTATCDGGISADINTNSEVPVYRLTVAKEIRDALRALPNYRIPDVTVETITNAGRFAQLQGDNTSPTTGEVKFTSLPIATSPVNDVQVGDYLRIGKEMRRVKTVDAGNNKVTVDVDFVTTLRAGASEVAVINKQNGFRYDITFEWGCRTHWDCRNNGIDEEDSDQKTGGNNGKEGDGIGATCHPGGSCQCSNDFTHGGNGCTKDRRATHANARLSVSGNLDNLICDSNGLIPSDVLGETATVTRVEPSTVAFSGAPSAPGLTVGDQIGIEGQVRTVVSVDTVNNKIKVDRPFEEDSFSTNDNIFDGRTPVNRLEPSSSTTATYSAIIQCFATDMPALQVSGTECNDGTEKSMGCGVARVKDYSGDKYNTSIANRIVLFEGDTGLSSSNLVGNMFDVREVEIGDRIRIYTSTYGSAAPVWETRTVDSIILADGTKQRDGKTTNALTNEDGGEKGLPVVKGFTVSEEFTSSSDFTGRIFVDNSGTTEAASCSNRGLCDESTGECQCFNGYTDVDCSKQNALAL